GTTRVASVEKSDESSATRVYQVWYATNREPVKGDSVEIDFSGCRDAVDKMHYGVCEVSIPKWHTIGSIGSHWIKRWLTCEDDRLQIKRSDVLQESTFWHQMQAYLHDEALEQEILLFIHGYNVDFKNAVLRCAQLGFDLQVPGLAAVFSWPSKG